MAFLPISIGDILMLSQAAWRVSRAFACGKCSAPAEFSEVEREANGLSDALRITAETLHSDDSVLDHAEHETKAAVREILSSAKRTLEDLESFIERYQVIKKRQTPGGFDVERSWREGFVANYKTIRWTTKGGDIAALRNMLHMHTNTINLTMQALQSRSLTRIERTVLPMAQNIVSIHSRVNGDIGEKIDDLHRLIMSVTNSTPALRARDRNIEATNGSELHERVRSSISERRLTEYDIQRQYSSSESSGSFTLNLAEAAILDPSATDRRSGSVRSQHIDEEGASAMVASGRRDNSRPGTSSSGRQQPNTPRRDSMMLSSLSSTMSSGGSVDHSFVSHKKQYPATPATIMGSPESHDQVFQSQGNAVANVRNGEQGTLSRTATLPAFERSLFCNSAILCDIRGRLVEYAQKVEHESDPQFDVTMVGACSECSIRVIRKRENRAHGGTKLTTSIWAISADGAVRLQLKLSEMLEMVPYASFFEGQKVSIAPDASGVILLQFHGERWIGELEREVKTNWINYIFESKTDAFAFQSALFGRTLVASFKTTKTTIIHYGLMGMFAFEEQFANIEMLRIWEDDGIAITGAQGGILALMHISSNFGDGWARWWMNCSSRPVKVKSNGSKHVKLKGINVLVAPPGIAQGGSISRGAQNINVMDAAGSVRSRGRRGSMRKVTGVRIEFNDEVEKESFLELCRRAQDPARMRPLPAL